MNRNLLPMILAVCGAIAPVKATLRLVPQDFKQIQSAIEEAEEGDTVYIAKGVYRENITMREQIVVQGRDREKTVLRGDGKNPVVLGASHATIRDLTIQEGGTGIRCENTNTIITGTIIRNNKQSGIHCLVSLPHIYNNIIYRNRGTGIFCELISSGVHSSITHNVIAENHYSGIMLANRSEVVIENCVIYKNHQYGIFVSDDSRRSRIIHNDIFGNRVPFNQYAWVDKTNISKDPEFVKTGFNTVAYIAPDNSPLRGAGTDNADIGLMSEAALHVLSGDDDNDSIPNSDDLCRYESEDRDGYEDEDGCPDFDNDFDGRFDAVDACPDAAEDIDQFEDGDGCPDTDNDNDGVNDNADACPRKPETVNGFKDEDGCPDEREE